MAKPKVLVADKLAAEGIAALKAGGLETIVLEQPPKAKDLAAHMRKVDAVVVRSATKITSSCFGPKTKVRVIGRAGIGVDNIDVEAATGAGIVVLNTPDANAATTAELAVAHMFSLARRLTQADASVRAGKWEKSKFTGTEIAGKTIGVVGYGTIGRIVAARCRGLSMRVLVHDPFVAGGIVEADGCEPATMPKLLREADVVTIHTPGGKNTEGLIDAAALRRMKKSAFLIQCARGGIVDERALAAALRKGAIAGAAVDVFTAEPPPEDHPLRGVPNIVYSPHLGASTAEAQRATGVQIAKSIATFFSTGEVINAVNLPRIAPDLLAVAKPYLPLARKLGKLVGALCQTGTGTLSLRMEGEAAALPGSLVLSEILSGLLSNQLSIPVNQVNAAHLAESRGITTSVSRRSETSGTLLGVELRSGRRCCGVTGTLLGGDQPRISSLDGIELEAALEGPVLLTMHQDRPGVVAKLATMLADKRINIANMHVGSDAKRKKAIAILGLNKELDDRMLAAIDKLRFIERMIHLKL